MTAPIIRFPDWQPRLQQWLHRLRQTPMRPGHHDCCLFGAGAVEAQTGVDLAAPYRGRYSTFAGGRRVLRKDGHDDHVALIAAHLPEAHVIEAMPGDIAIVPGEDGPAVGVVQGAFVYVLGPNGRINFAPMEPVQRLFRVPF